MKNDIHEECSTESHEECLLEIHEENHEENHRECLIETHEENHEESHEDDITIHNLFIIN